MSGGTNICLGISAGRYPIAGEAEASFSRPEERVLIWQGLLDVPFCEALLGGSDATIGAIGPGGMNEISKKKCFGQEKAILRGLDVWTHLYAHQTAMRHQQWETETETILEKGDLNWLTH